MTGSDTTNEWVIPGESLHQEFELLVEAGIPPKDVLNMTGATAAEILGLDNRGFIEKGYKADLVLLEENPEIDITNTRSIIWVMVHLDRDLELFCHLAFLSGRPFRRALHT